jgi:hypothetical protein
MGVAYVTLENPPANSYDLAVMQKFASDGDVDANTAFVEKRKPEFVGA